MRDIQTLPDAGRLYAAHVIHDIWRLTGGQAVVATDVGQHQMWEAQYYHHEQPRSLITSAGLGTMGFGVPAALGAKLARPDAEVWAIVGDGGFQMTQAELATAAQERVKINVAIINNGYLGMVRQPVRTSKPRTCPAMFPIVFENASSAAPTTTVSRTMTGGELEPIRPPLGAGRSSPS